MITPDSWKPQGLVSLLFAPSTIAIAAFLFGEEPASERGDLWLLYWIFLAVGAVATGIGLAILNRKGRLIRPTEEATGAPVSRRPNLGAVAFVALAALFYGVVPGTGHAILWGLFSGGLILFVVVANMLGYKDWRARTSA
jgi:hypothetical protein